MIMVAASACMLGDVLLVQMGANDARLEIDSNSVPTRLVWPRSTIHKVAESELYTFGAN